MNILGECDTKNGNFVTTSGLQPNEGSTQAESYLIVQAQSSLELGQTPHRLKPVRGDKRLPLMLLPPTKTGW
jgi:hypothetical protein